MNRQSPGISPASSTTSLSGSLTPRDSTGPLSPLGATGDRSRKGGGIQMQIQQLQDEQERVQKKTFTNWMNTYLKQKSPPLKVENLFEDIKDGVVLLSLLEVLSGEKLPMERGKLKRVHYVSNLSTALKFLESKKIKLVNINVSDIADGKASIVLGLIWTIILYFQIEETMVAQNATDAEGEQRPLSALDKFRMNAKKALLAWTENAITKRYGIEIKDFGKSWRDGLAFNAIVHTIRPDLVDMESVKRQSARVNLENAFSTAENHLGIARLLDPEDVDVAKPDEKSVMTYVAQFLKAYPEAGEDPALRKKIRTPAEQEMSDLQELMTWCTTEAEEVLQIVEQPVTDRQQEYMDYLAFKAEVDRRGNIYGRLEEKVKSGKAVRVTPEQFAPLEKEWKKVVRQTRLWLWKLDSSLPGKLGKFGDWLNQAEEILEQEEEILENPEEMAALLGKFLQDHKAFFKELEPQRQFFLQVKRAGRYEGEAIPAPQMDNLYQRLQTVCTMAPKRERRLEYEEMKYQLLAYLVASENKLKIWTVKYGHQESVEELLADYKHFVVAGNLFKNYDKTYDTCKRNADAYRKAKIDKDEVEKISNYFDEVNGRWKKVSVEIKSVQSMLDEVIDCWRKYNACVDVLTVWLNDGERVMSRSPEEKQQFFSDLAQYEEKHKILNEAGNFLIETTEEPVAAEIKQTLLMLNRRFKDLVDQFQHFKQVEVVGKARKEYSDGLLRLTQWLKDAEELIAQEIPCKHSVLKDYLNEIDKYGAQIPSIENDFKVTTKTAQSLVKESSQDIVTEMLQSLNIQKEVLVRLRKEIPERVKHIKAVMPNVESLETGLVDLNAWLDNGEALLESHRLDGSQEEAEQRLEQHKAFFSEITYQKSIVESKNKVYQKVNASKPKLKNVDFSVIDQPVEEMNRRFQMCVSKAKDWEKKLENLSRLWRVLNQKQNVLESWLEQAQAVLEDTEDDYESIIRKHKGFFVRVDERMLKDYLRAGQDILCVLEEEDRPALTESMENLQQRWEDMLAKAELNVAQHTAYHDACNNFVSWLRYAREKLATCSDTFGEKSAIQGKIERAAALVEGLNEGAQRLAEATKAGESTLPCTSPTGQTKIRQELKSMNKDFEEFRTELMSAQEDLEECLTRWTEFEDGYLHFNNWLKETESYLRSELEFKSSLDEKKRHWEQYQGFTEDIQYKQSELDQVNEKAQSLLQTNADAKTSHAITQLTTRYQGVIALSKDIVKNLANYYNNHLHYNDGHKEFTNWLSETKLQLQTVHRTAGSKEDIGTKLDNMNELQAAMDQGHVYLRQMLECSEKTLPNTNTRGCQKIRHECENAKAEYENLLTDMSQAKRGLESALNQWGDFDRSFEQFHVWLTAMEAKVNTDPGMKTDLPEKRSSLEKFKALQADCIAHREPLERIEEKAANVNDAHPQSRVLDLRSRYAAVCAAMKEVVGRLDHQVSGHEEYRKCYIGCLDWMANTRHRLQRLSDFSGDRRTLQDRLQQLKDFKGEMRQGQDMVNNATQLGERVCLTTAPRGQDAIHKEIQTLRDDWSSFSAAVNEVESNLETCIGNWVEMDDALAGFTHWIEKMERQMKSLNESKSDSSRKEILFREAEDLLHEIMNKKSTLDLVREKGEAVAQRSTDPRLSNNMMQLTTRYQGLLSGAKNLVGQLSENAHDHKEYNDAFDAATKWLAAMEERVQDCNDTAGDWHSLQDRMDAIKNITACMDEGLQKVNRVCDLAEKILPNTSSEGKRLIEQQVTELTNEWEKLNMSITDCNAMLEGVQERWNDYEEYYGSLVKWLADMENTLGMDPEPKASLVEKKTQLDKYKLIMSDIENHQRMVNELAERVANLEALSENPEITDSLQDVQNRYDRVRNRCRELLSKLDRNYQEHLGFHEAQQESEKWLLQTSFRLMNHNSLNCSTMELTQRQIEKHRTLLREIEEYRNTLDRVNMKGRRLIDNNSRTPRLAEQMQAQLQNLEESYINLQATAEQIRDRLNDVLKRWQEYRGNLETTDRFLKQEFPHWLKETDSDTPDSKNDAQRKMEGVKGMMERLNNMHQEIENAAQRCENLGSTDNLDESDLPQNTPIHKLATQVTADLQHATGEVERRLNQLRDNMQQWDSVDRMRVDLRAWLHDMQEEVDELEKKPSKLHAEACEVDINKLQGIREEVQARGPAVESLLSRYKELTQHNPDLQDPVVKAVKDDWEELLGQIENLIEDREQALQAAKELQARENEMDDDLENYINELEKIESADVATTQKAAMMKTRKPCRSTQTPRGSARNPNRSFLTGDSDGDSDDDRRFQFPPRPRPGSRNSSFTSLKRKRGPGGPRSPSRLSRGSRPGSRLKKSASGAALDSDSEESGYGETYYTMHASSFDNVLDDTVFGTQTPNTMRGTPLGLENHFSDGESTVSYLSTHAFATNPDDLRDAMSQTPGHTSTQTPADMWKKSKPRAMQTQTGSNTSLHSIGNQTRRSSGSRADLLRSILFEVKGMKHQRGLDDSTYTDDDTNSVRSENTIKKETLQHVLNDVRELREADATGTAATQTVNEEGTQTSMKLFPEGDPIRNARLEKFKNLMDDVKDMKGSRPGTPASRSRVSSRSATPRQQPRTPSRLNTTFESPIQNGFHSYAPQNLNATAPAAMMNYQMPPQPPQPTLIGGRRLVTQEDLNNLNQRIQRLQGYQTPRRPDPPPPPPQPQYVIPVYAAPPSRRKPPQDDAYLSDESEYGDVEPPRRRHVRSSIEGALAEASRSALQLKRLSKRMKDSLRDDMQYDFL